MAVYFKTNSPQRLLNLFKKAIADNKIVTWTEKDGYFTHDTKTDQWKGLAYFFPQVKPNALILNIIKPKDRTISSEVYAIYHGRVIETMLAHFDKEFSEANATALAEAGDLVN
ncbi:MAG: hypothetical protein IPG12_10860 [Saprospiraceae bacterium]|nr:hypothetical protein [Saprospiraceae bacterium]